MRKKKQEKQSKKSNSMTKIHNQTLENFDMRKKEVVMSKKSKVECDTVLNDIQQEEVDYILKTYDILQEYITLGSDENSFSKKGNLLEEYYLRVDPSYIPEIQEDLTEGGEYCKTCNIFLENEDGFAICTGCGASIKSVYTSKELSYKEMQELDYKTYFAYDKMTHFEEWLRRFESKENRMIPQRVLDSVIQEATKMRIELCDITDTNIRAILKKLNMNEYYENKISIINRINNREPFILIPRVKDKLKNMFRKIQEPYIKYKDPDRRNMFSYPYLINKFFLILNLPEFSKYFTLLKSPHRLRKQDKTFLKIVEELAISDPETNWRFFPSL